MANKADPFFTKKMLQTAQPIIKTSRKWDKFRTVLPLHVLIFPGVLFTFIFSYIPMYGIIIAFKNFNPTKGIINSEWVGLKYFNRLFKMSDFFEILSNTIVIALLKISTMIIFSLVIALLINEVQKKWLRGSIQSLMIFPHFLSWIILGALVKSILANDGMLNRIIMLLGMEPVFFLGNQIWFRIVLIISNLWQETGFSAIIFIAAISGIDSTLYEAAKIDGANRWKQTVHITLSGILPFILLIVILNMGNILNAGFDQIFNLYNGTVMKTADIIDTYVYRVGLMGAQYSFGAAVGLFKSLVGMVLIGISYYLADKFANYRIF